MTLQAEIYQGQFVYIYFFLITYMYTQCKTAIFTHFEIMIKLKLNYKGQY